MVFIVIPAVYCGSLPIVQNLFPWPSTQDAVEVSIECRRMSRRTRLLMLIFVVYDSRRDKEKTGRVGPRICRDSQPEYRRRALPTSPRTWEDGRRRIEIKPQALRRGQAR